MKEEKIILLIHKVITGEATGDEQVTYSNWLNEDEANSKYSDEIATIWRLSDKIVKDDVDFDKDRIKSNIFSKIAKEQILGNEKKYEKSHPKIIRLNKIASIAAVFLLLLGAVFAFNHYFSTEVFKSGNSVNLVQLSDNSKIWLDENSLLKVKKSFNKNNRTTILEGNAYFNIAKNKDLPFIVYVEDSKIKVTGTSFAVWSDDSKNVTVNVTSGIVKFVANQENTITLTKGEGAEYIYKTKTLSKINKESFKDDFRFKYLSFENAKLNDVFDKLGKYYNVKFDIECGEINNMSGFTSPGNKSIKIEDYFLSILKLYPIGIEKTGSNSYKVFCK